MVSKYSDQCLESTYRIRKSQERGCDSAATLIGGFPKVLDKMKAGLRRALRGFASGRMGRLRVLEECIIAS